MRETPDLELALMRRGVGELEADRARCRRCRRTPLIGERVHVYRAGAVVCELCRGRERDEPLESRLVHGPEYGHTMKIIDRRPRISRRSARSDPAE